LIIEVSQANSLRRRLLRFNWLIFPVRAIAARAAKHRLAKNFESDAGNRNHRTGKSDRVLVDV